MMIEDEFRGSDCFDCSFGVAQNVNFSRRNVHRVYMFDSFSDGEKFCGEDTRALG